MKNNSSFKKGKIFILSGPSGSGKTTLYKKLLKEKKLKGMLVRTISFTTRPSRPGEKWGRDYFFISRRMFLYKIKKGHFLEWQKVFDNFYGTSQKIVKGILNSGKNVLMCIDVKGARIVSRKFPEAVKVFIKTTSLEELKKRLIQRGSEDQKKINLRIKIARKELAQVSHYNYVVINKNIQKSYYELKNVVLTELNRFSLRSF